MGADVKWKKWNSNKNNLLNCTAYLKLLHILFYPCIYQQAFTEHPPCAGTVQALGTQGH